MSDVVLAKEVVTEEAAATLDVFESLDVLEITMDILRQHAAMVKRYGVFTLIIITVPASKVKTEKLAHEIADQVNRHSPQNVDLNKVGDEYKFIFQHT